MTSQETIAAFIAEFGPEPNTRPLIAAGWTDISHERGIAAKPEYTTGEGLWKAWPAGFSELLDGRIVYRCSFGMILAAPSPPCPVR